MARAAEVLDAMVETGAIPAAFAKRHLPLLTNSLHPANPATTHDDPCQPSFYRQLEKEHGPLHALVFDTPRALCDLALPLAERFAVHGVFARVPPMWLLDPPAPRLAWLRRLQAQGRLCAFSGFSATIGGLQDGVWLCIFRSPAVRQRMLKGSPESAPLLMLG